ncbi:MAG: YihY/virulence factor BrkB family protein [Pseudomonadales bacterium]|nr:YihY/virulence factor BrkB family protein [Pseudomonadales bacterium]
MAISFSSFSTLIEAGRKQLDHLLWSPKLETLPFWHRFLLRSARISYAVIRDLGEGQLSLRAMGLVYYTVISMIPLLALTFSVLKGLGAHNAMEPALLSVLAPLGERSTEVTTNIISFVDNVRVDVLSVISLGVLLYTVLAMMQRIEYTFNYIWTVRQARTLANRISEYLFAIIVSPLLIFISIGITSYVNTNVFALYLETLNVGADFLQIIGFVTPFLFMSLAFAFAYSFIPNTRVKFGSAFVGGILTTIIWKTMAWVFQSFFVTSTTNAIVYLAFFTVILVMVFIYLGWLVLLIGSNIAFYHQYPEKARFGRQKLEPSIREQEELCLNVAYLIISRFQQKLSPWSSDALATHLQINHGRVMDVLSLLMDTDFIRATDEDPAHYLPAKAVADMSLTSLLSQIRKHSGRPSAEGTSPHIEPAIKKFMADSEQLLEQQIGKQRFSDLIDHAQGEKTK